MRKEGEENVAEGDEKETKPLFVSCRISNL
jgi:hypothetical protein